MEKKFSVSIEQTHEFTSEDISDLVCSAFYGNDNFIAIAKKLNGKFVGISDEDAPNIQYYHDVLSYGGIIVVYDKMDKENKWELTNEKMLKGIARYCLENNENLSDLLDNHDAFTADSIIQYALFDEIVYG